MKVNVNGTEFEVKVLGKWLCTETKGICKGRHFWKYYFEVSANGYAKRFTFSNSIADYEKGKTALTKKDKINALWCFLNDALSYYENQNIDDFMRCFGYDNYEEYKNTIKAYLGCQDAYFYFITIFNNDEMCEAVNYLSEKYNL